MMNRNQWYSFMDRGAVMRHSRVSSLHGHQGRRVVDHRSMGNGNHRCMDKSSSSVVDNLVALGDGSLRDVVDLMDRHNTDGMNGMDRDSTVVDYLVGLSNGSLGMDDGDAMDFMDGVVDVSAAVVNGVAVLGVGGLAERNRVDDVRRFIEVGRCGGPASQDGADDDLEN